MAKKKIKKSLLKKSRQCKLSNFLPFKSVLNRYFVFNKSNYEKYKEYTKAIKDKKKAKRKKIISVLSIVLNIAILAIVLTVSLANEGFEAIELNLDARYLAVLVALTFGIFFFDSLKIYLLVLASTKKSRPFLSFKTSALGKYYDAITPSSIGGQPFQMLYMNKRGINGAISTSIPLMKTMFWQISNVLFCAFVLIFGTASSLGLDTNPAAQVLAWVGLAAQTIAVLSIFLLSVSKKVGPKIVIWALKVLSKMHIVKNYRSTFRNVMRFVANYQKTFRAYAKNLWLIIAQFIVAFAEIFVYNLIPYFIYKTFVPEGTLPWTQFFMQSMICSLSMMFIPTPGASGGAEALFTVVFASAFNGKPFWPLLFWRFSTYYSVLVIGLIVLIYDFIIGNKKLEKLQQQTKEDISEEQQLKKLEVSFRERLKEQIARDKQDIQTVREQERDKIFIQALNQNHTKKSDKPDIIKNSQIVSENEIEEIVYPAEKVLDEMIEKENQRKVKRTEKKLKKQNKNKKQ